MQLMTEITNTFSNILKKTIFDKVSFCLLMVLCKLLKVTPPVGPWLKVKFSLLSCTVDSPHLHMSELLAFLFVVHFPLRRPFRYVFHLNLEALRVWNYLEGSSPHMLSGAVMLPKCPCCYYMF